MTQALVIEVPSGSKLIDVVRDLVREGQLPLYWRCGQGTCGACLVFLENRDATIRNGSNEIALTGKERNVLLRMKRLTPTQAQQPALTDTPELPRLACHVLLTPGEWWVRW